MKILTLNNNRKYSWNIPVTLRSKKPLSVILTLSNGILIIYNDVSEYEHLFDNYTCKNNAYIEFANGDYVIQPLEKVESINLKNY
jgi:hypothetical protein